MSCKNLGIYGKIADISQPAIVKGSDAFIVTEILYKGEDSPYKLSGFIGATGYFKKADLTTLTATGSLQSSDLGQIKFSLSESETTLLNAGEEESFEILFEDDNGVKIIQFDGRLQVNDRLF